MEGVPQLPMLSAPLKTTPEKSDFASKIRWQIREHFNEDPNSYVNEVRELESLRASACHPPVDFTGCALLKKYFSQLHFLQNRFNFDEGGHDEVIFPWNDIYTGMAYSTGDIKHEMACALYNIGALHTILGAMDNRQTADGMKMSCSHFQCAAWAFQHLNEKFPQLPETDLCHEIISFLMTVSLAQAQECILQKSIVDGRKAGIVAKVAAQIVEYYKSAQKILMLGNKNFDGNPVAEVVGSKIFKSWKKFCEFKLSYHQCVSLLYMGINCEELQKMGDRVAYFQLAMDKLAEATKLAKQVDRGGVDEAIQFAHDVVGGKLKAAEKENEFVYHEKVPEKTTLPEIKGASLVKGTPFDITDPEVSGQDIFHRLVPMEAHEASSLYSEEKAKLLRRIGASVEEKDQELAMFLASLQVDQLKFHNEPQTLPQELIDRCAAFSVQSNAVGSLVEAMSKLSSVYTDVEAGLNEIHQLLDEEQGNEKLFQSGQGKRPPSMILKELSLEASRYKDAHAKAAESNMLLHKAINSHLANLRTLSLPLSEIQAQLPSLQVLESSKDQAAIKELQRLLDKVDEMRKQRIMFYTQLREGLQADDITKLATHNSDHDSLFAQELNKHQPRVSLIEQNLSAQENILKALTETNARYADTRRATADIQHRRSATVAALLASADAYPELLSKCEKGSEFYRKLDTNVTKLLQRLRSVCRVQQEEREQQEAARMRPIKNDLRSVIPGDLSGSLSDRVVSDPSNDGPKLRDFLHLMKKDRNATDGLSAVPNVAQSGPAAVSQMAANAGPVDAGNYSYPNHRPAPVGAEQNDPKSCSSSSSYVPHPQDGSDKAYQYYNPSAYPSPYPGSNPTNGALYGSAGYGAPYQRTDALGYYAGSGYPPTMPSYPLPTSSPATSTPVTVSSAAASYSYYPQQYTPASNPSQGNPTSISTTTPSVAGTVTPAFAANQITGGTGQSNVATPAMPHQSYLPYSPSTAPAPTSDTSHPIHTQMYSSTTAPSISAVTTANSHLNYQQMYTASIPADSGSSTAYSTYPQSMYPSASTPVPATSAATHPSYSPQMYSSAAASISTVSNTTTASHPAYAPPMYATPTASQYPYEYSNAATQQPSYGTNPPTQQLNYEIPPAAGYPYQYPSVNGAAYGYPTSTVSSSVSQGGSSTAVASYEYGSTNSVPTSAYQHGFASTSVAYGASTVTTAASNYGYSSSTPSGQTPYYQYPYYGVDPQREQQQNPAATPADPATQVYYAAPQYGDFSAYASATPLQPQSTTVPESRDVNPALNNPPNPAPLPAAAAPAQPAPATLAAEPVAPKPTSNLELLSLLDLSVPSGPSGALLEPLSQGFSTQSWRDVNNTTNTVTTTTPVNIEDKKINLPAAITSPVELPLLPRPSTTALSSGTAGTVKDPLTDPDVASKLASDVEKFDKLVDGLTRKSLNGPTPLDLKWKEVQELQEKESAKRSISVARCYPMKNRFPDVLPYDHNRVELPTTKDDYINASQISALSSAGPSYIATQCPLPCTQQDFWTMLWQNQVEIIVCLLSDAEMKGSLYWPTEKGRDVACGPWLISLQSANVRPNSVERILTLTKQGETKQNRVLIHLQFTAWPGSSFPPSPVQFLNFSAELLQFWKQQRSAAHPIVVHCLAGAGRTGLLCLICAALADLSAGHGIIDVVRVAAALCQQRRNMFRDREHLLFAYQAILYHAQDLLMKRGILCGKTTLQGSPAKVHHSRHPSQDFIQGLGSPHASVSPAPSSITGATDDDVLDSAPALETVSTEAEDKPEASQTESQTEQQSESPAKMTGALAILDPANFTLDPKSPQSSSAARIRVTKDSFLNNKGSPQKIGAVTDPNDPLSQLDPLWSLAKE